MAFSQELYKLPRNWARDVSNTSNLELSIFSLGFTNSTCTGTLISNEGHILTARHCLEKAIDMAREMKKRGYSVDEIAEISGLKKTAIHNLKVD